MTDAETVTAWIADRLADPDRVVALGAGADNVDRIPGGGGPWPVWPAGNPSGAGIAMLHSELGDRQRAHAHLATAVGAVAHADHAGMVGGLAGIAFAARLNARAPDDYAGALRTLDGHLSDAVAGLAAGVAVRPVGSYATFDVISGLAGIGGYQLLSGDCGAVLTALTSLATPTTVDGHEVPGWWVRERPGLTDSGRHALGHLNLGAAHGIAGPLALLALAWRAGVRVDGQGEAIDTLVEALMRRAVPAGDGYRWPAELSIDDERGGSRPTGDRKAWCYGTPGVARSIQLAALARDRADWAELAVASLRRVLDDPHLGHAIGDNAGLCHGWAGLLLLAVAAAADSEDSAADGLRPAADRLTGEVLRLFDPDAPFGFRHPLEDSGGYTRGPDRPGFLDGAAGIALALSAYTGGWPPRTRWPTALLIG